MYVIQAWNSHRPLIVTTNGSLLQIQAPNSYQAEECRTVANKLHEWKNKYKQVQLHFQRKFLRRVMHLSKRIVGWRIIRRSIRRLNEVHSKCRFVQQQTLYCYITPLNLGHLWLLSSQQISKMLDVAAKYMSWYRHNPSMGQAASCMESRGPGGWGCGETEQLETWWGNKNWRFSLSFLAWFKIWKRFASSVAPILGLCHVTVSWLLSELFKPVGWPEVLNSNAISYAT